jgi:hypothetical protein
MALPRISRKSFDVSKPLPALPSAERMRASALNAMTEAIEEGEREYERRKALARFHRLSSETIEAETPEAAQAVLREIARALRAERARMGHWSYDLNRHIGLTIAYRCEKARADRISQERRETHCRRHAKTSESGEDWSQIAKGDAP